MTGPAAPTPPQEPAPAPVDVRLTPVRAVMSSTVVAVRSGCHLSVAVDTSGETYTTQGGPGSGTWSSWTRRAARAASSPTST